MKKVFMRSDGVTKVQTVFEGDEAVSLTQQQFADQCDVNIIMKRYMSGKPITHVNTRSGVYGDFTEIGSYQDALSTVMKARESFDTLPSDVRNRFGNNPQQLIDFLNNKDNVEESIKLGLRVKPEVKVDPVVEEIKGLREDMKVSRKSKSKEVGTV